MKVSLYGPGQLLGIKVYISTFDFMDSFAIHEIQKQAWEDNYLICQNIKQIYHLLYTLQSYSTLKTQSENKTPFFK